MVAFTLTAFSQNNYRDIVHLKNGSVIKGMIIEQIPNKQIKLETSDGSVFVYEMDEIEKMSKEKIESSSSFFSYSGKNTDISSPTAKGRIFVSGSSRFSYSSSTREDENSDYEVDINEFNFKPSIGWFVSDGFSIALSIDYESSKQEYNSEEYNIDEQQNSTFLMGPNLTYYLGDSNIKPFIQGEYVFGNSKTETKYENRDKYDSETKMNGWGLGAGIAFFLNQNISLDFGLGYANISGENDDNDSETTQKGVSLQGGFSVYF